MDSSAPREHLHTKDDLTTCIARFALFGSHRQCTVTCQILHKKLFHTVYPEGPQHCYINALEKGKETASRSEAKQEG